MGAFSFTIPKGISVGIAITVALILGMPFTYDGILTLILLALNIYFVTSLFSMLGTALSKQSKLYLLLGLFVAALTAANLLGAKVATFWGITVSVGIFSYPLTFLITDGVSEVFGKHVTKRFVMAGVGAQLLVILFILLSINLPPASRFAYNSEYVTVFSLSLRIVIASVIAFLVSQLYDIWSFHMWKQVTKGKFLWLRNNFSTVVSQLIDSLLFMFIAFYQMTPKFTAAFVLSITIPYWILKVVMAIIDTPFCYLMVNWLRK